MRGDLQSAHACLVTASSEPSVRREYFLTSLLQRIIDKDGNFERLAALVQAISAFKWGPERAFTGHVGVVLEALLRKYYIVSREESRLASYKAYLLRLIQDQQSIITPEFYAKGLSVFYSSNEALPLYQGDPVLSSLLKLLLQNMSVEDVHAAEKDLPMCSSLAFLKECCQEFGVNTMAPLRVTSTSLEVASVIPMNIRQLIYLDAILGVLKEHFASVVATLIKEYLA